MSFVPGYLITIPLLILAALWFWWVLTGDN